MQTVVFDLKNGNKLIQILLQGDERIEVKHFKDFIEARFQEFQKLQNQPEVLNNIKNNLT